MGLKGKMTVEKEIKCHGDVFHDLFRHKPHHLANITPDHIQGCDLHEAEFGTLGSVTLWKYTDEGKEKYMKVVIEAIDEEKKLVKFKAVEGDVLQIYKEYTATIHVDTNGDDHLVTWTIAYEKLSEDSPDPISLLNIAIKSTNEIEAHHVK
ncbi:hypothetical protein BUALT_Bualt05G0110200 [Buddleja alternifolia]|uniref:Bet v I/Major latex protein domain-containing protein n=1 Tax=Buddleja alternifolia TaxID=168488 RepID=A0AAV6XIG7_9LAMI|nr:hypothetical protein BUALT_Bualt05G0110200 [Buddleja alternifolia]